LPLPAPGDELGPQALGEQGLAVIRELAQHALGVPEEGAHLGVPHRGGGPARPFAAADRGVGAGQHFGQRLADGGRGDGATGLREGLDLGHLRIAAQRMLLSRSGGAGLRWRPSRKASAASAGSHKAPTRECVLHGAAADRDPKPTEKGGGVCPPAQAWTMASSFPSRSSWARSVYPPTWVSPMKICGTVRWPPEAATRRWRSSGSWVTSISSKAMFLRFMSSLARTQKPQEVVV